MDAHVPVCEAIIHEFLAQVELSSSSFIQAHVILYSLMTMEGTCKKGHAQVMMVYTCIAI